MKDEKDVKATGPPVLANSLINFINRSHKKVLGTGWKTGFVVENWSATMLKRT